MATPSVLFVAPAEEAAAAAPAARRRRRATSDGVAASVAHAGSDAAPAPDADDEADAPVPADAPDAELEATAQLTDDDSAEDVDGDGSRRRRRRGRRGRGARSGADDDGATAGPSDESDGADAPAGDTPAESGDTEPDAAEGSSSSHRRRRRRRSGDDADAPADEATAPSARRTRERAPGRGTKNDESARSGDDEVRGIRGSSRLEAKRQRRRDGRDTGRRRAPILSDAEFLARRESVDRVMAVRQRGDRTQIAILEDGILVEHYVTRASATSYVGNVYLGRVQNVLPSMEAAFVDIGKGRNGVLYAGEVNWDAAGLEGRARAIEAAMRSGDALLVQVTKDPIGHKGARLTSQISLPGRFLVYVPGGGMTGISRKLPDTERTRLKAILKKIVPDEAGVIVRTAAEGASEEDLTSDVERLKAEWDSIQARAARPGDAPALVHGEPDLATRVVRDVFNEDFASMIVDGDEAWTQVSEYVQSVAPDLAARVHRHTGTADVFTELRVDEQLAKALDRKVWLPSGGSLVIDRTEAMVVIDVNTGKFTGSGGNLEQTVTRNNLEAAEEIVRQLRLRDVGGIIVIDFIDMVLESNRDLVLRRLTECLGRDRTKHQVAEVTSLGLVQMTRKRVGEGLLEAFSEPCEHCHGRGVLVHSEPIERRTGESGQLSEDPGPPAAKRTRRTKAQRVEDQREAEEAARRRQAAAEAMNAIARRAAAGDADAIAAVDGEAVSSPEPADAPTGTATVSADEVEEVVAAYREAEVFAPAGGLGDDAEYDTEVHTSDGHLSENTGAAPSAAGQIAAGEPSTNGAGRGPRRRRAASRPAGPPQPVGTHARGS
ncbi:MAG: Rne/Rng family ribonuclease [bacterium]